MVGERTKVGLIMEKVFGYDRYEDAGDEEVDQWLCDIPML
jgi:hypothetical protein